MVQGRLVRGEVLALKEQEYILAAKTSGMSSFKIILKELLPNVMTPVIVSVTLTIGSSILFEAALSFLGLGIQPPTPSWGNMLNNAQEIIYSAPLLAVIPGILILIIVISFNFLGDGLQDALDPKAIRR
jgi:peptide/nickel transport system permease protein